LKVRVRKQSKTGLVAALFMLLPVPYAESVSAHDVVKGGRLVSTPQQLNRKPNPPPPSNIPGSPHQHVYQRQEYGKTLRQGHSVNGPYGDITIWSPAPQRAYQAPATSRPGMMRKQPATPLTGPKLQYVPDYGKSPDKKR
jgi:hypothetical protein